MEKLKQRSISFVASISLFLGALQTAGAGPLEDYVQTPDSSYSWIIRTNEELKGFQITTLNMTSQSWHDTTWQHKLMIVKPAKIRHPESGFLFITGDGDPKKYLEMLGEISSRAGTIAAVIMNVPNQPLYGGKKEDALIAYTFDRYLKTKDQTWPLLLPMVKSAVRAMDTISAWSKESGAGVTEFVVSGASKRGWTTWLTSATDKRVKAAAPMVIDMLNMPAQVKWAEKMYGQQSEEIKDYTDLNLIAKMDDPDMVALRQIVDPYNYRSRYKMPKLILLGTNDPYWVVDSLRHYWDDIPEPKEVFQTPNAGHDLAGGKEAIPTLAEWYRLIVDKEKLPDFNWKINYPNADKATLQLHSDGKPIRFRLWTAVSTDRDFRNDQWTSQDLEIKNGKDAEIEITRPAEGYRAFMGEVTYATSSGKEFKLSTQARVVPDGKN